MLDGGELPGTPSTVVDLRAYEGRGEWSIAARIGAVAEEVDAAMADEVDGAARRYAVAA